MKGKLRKRRRTALLYCTFLLALTAGGALAAEIILRWNGSRPFRQERPAIQVEPGGKKHQLDQLLGYKNLPGRYRITLQDTFSFVVTHRDDTLRVTAADDRYSGLEGVWILGDSFVYGTGLNDEETFPWILQSLYPEYEVVNFGVEGYSTVQALLQIEEGLKTSRPPKAIILGYASFHVARNAPTRTLRKSRALHSFLGPVALPSAELDSHGELHLRHAEPYEPWPLARRSALVNVLHDHYNALVDRGRDDESISRALLGKINSICLAHGIRLIVANLWQPADDTEAFCRDRNILFVDLSLDLKRPENNNLPYESHPSAYANLLYGLRLSSFLDEHGVLGEPSEARRIRDSAMEFRILGLSRQSFQRGQYEKSVHLCRRALEFVPNSALAYNNLCAAQGKLGDREEAIASCEKALSLDPTLAEARRNLQSIAGQ